MILLIDNYDSFVYNLAQYLGEMGEEPVVYRNDQIALEEINALNPSHIIISPGPCTPLEAGISNDIIRRFGGRIPILGVCLGHQCIGHVYGSSLVPAVLPTHGKSSMIHHDGRKLYHNLPNPFEAGRYHSLTLDRDTIYSPLTLAAETDDGVVMGIRHDEYVVEGVQFHPESIMTDLGHDVLRNFLGFTQPRWTKE